MKTRKQLGNVPPMAYSMFGLEVTLPDVQTLSVNMYSRIKNYHIIKHEKIFRIEKGTVELPCPLFSIESVMANGGRINEARKSGKGIDDLLNLPETAIWYVNYNEVFPRTNIFDEYGVYAGYVENGVYVDRTGTVVGTQQTSSSLKTLHESKKDQFDAYIDYREEEGKILRFDEKFNGMEVKICYNEVETDEDGYPLITDSFVEAFVFYLLYLDVSKRWARKEVSYQERAAAEQDYDKRVAKARNADFKMNKNLANKIEHFLSKVGNNSYRSTKFLK